MYDVRLDMQKQRCPECGTLLSNDAGYCDSCGHQALRPDKGLLWARVLRYGAAAIALAVIAVALRFVRGC